MEALFSSWAGRPPDRKEALIPSGSDRRYFRLGLGELSAIGCWNPDLIENKAFVYLSKHFSSCGVPVPKILGEDLDARVYLTEDLGDQTLLELLSSIRQKTGERFPAEAIRLYKESLGFLAKMQISCTANLDYSFLQPDIRFDSKTIQWDLNYFKYYFLRLAGIPFDENGLEKDFQTLSDYLMESNGDFFLFRDFQARNIMVHKGGPWFIDFQGGRKGPLQYDVASLLYQAKARIPAGIKTVLLNHYLSEAERLTPINRDEFLSRFKGFVLIRLLQVLGAYGFRGWFQRKPHFLESIPYALGMIPEVLDHDFPIHLPVLEEILHSLPEAAKIKALNISQLTPAPSPLEVEIKSFSYKSGIPDDNSGHGGGFVFDCRGIPNPGRLPEYRSLTGRDLPVKTYLENKNEVSFFLADVFSIVDRSVSEYLKRGFTHLSVYFGCTGGQHRSVYCADQLSTHLKARFGVSISLFHVEQESKGWINS